MALDEKTRLLWQHGLSSLGVIMCGIIGYWGKEAFPILLDGLKKLEYRGYDSFGFATIHNGVLHIQRGVGKISSASVKPMEGKVGVGHSRWSTHGGVTIENAHPHTDCHKKIAVAHNGIVENYLELKKELQTPRPERHGSLGSANQAAGPGKSGSSGQVVAGHVFKSQTDTETIPHLIEDFLGKGLDFKEACRQAFLKLKGRNAFLALHAGTGELVAARKGSPLIVGVVGSGDEKEKEVFIASDVPAFLLRTNKVMYLDDGEMVSALHGVPRFYNTATGAEVKKRVVEIGWEAEQAEKGEYPHFMIKEIMEQKDTIARAINQPDSEIEKVAGLIARAKEVFFVGCGTAARVCHTAEYMFSGVAGKQVRSVPASEFWNYRHFLTKDALVVAISQSGETADTMEALEVAKAAGAKIVSLVNVQGSSMTRLSDYVFMINAGPEKAVASTKATTAQMAIVLLLAYAVAGKLKEGKRLLVDIAAKVNDMLNPRYVERIKELAERLRQKKNIFIIGRGFNYPMALESAIKIMEVSYIHAQGFAGGEMKHGPIALIERGSPVIVLTANDPVKHETISNAVELKARGAFIIGVGPENEKAFDYWIKTPEAGTAASPIVNIIPVQVLAYYLSIFIGNDPDFPKHLAKAVTVK